MSETFIANAVAFLAFAGLFLGVGEDEADGWWIKLMCWAVMGTIAAARYL